VSRSGPWSFVLVLALSVAGPARAQTGTAAPAASEPVKADPAPSEEESEGEGEGGPEAPAPVTGPVVTAPTPDLQRERLRDDLRRELQRDLDDQVTRLRKEIETERDRLRDQISYVGSEADARAYDAEQLKDLRQTVNLLQLHGYFRARMNLYGNFDVGLPADSDGYNLFPRAGNAGNSWLGDLNMRLRLNPILRVSDDIAVYGQLDVLDNMVAGSSVYQEPFFDGTTPAPIFGSRTAPTVLNLQRLWTEIETPAGQISFGRKPFHFGEGLVYNDGNCIDCDYGNTFDRIQLTGDVPRTIPVVGGLLVSLALDSLGEGVLSASNPALFSSYGQAFDLTQLDDANRLSLQVTRATPPAELRRRVDAGEVVVDWGALVAGRAQYAQSPTANGAPVGVDAFALEAGAYVQAWYRKFRLASEGAFLFGNVANRLENGALFTGQPLQLLQGAAVLRGQQAILTQDKLLIGVDLGWASGDGAPGMGNRPGRTGLGTNGQPSPGAIDGRQYACTPGGCTDNAITNFRMNPDFRLDQIMWRNMFVQITDAVFGRFELRFKPFGRASGGADDEGFEFSGSLMYSQAIYASSTPGNAGPLGVEANAAITYTSRDQFHFALLYGALVPLQGLTGTAQNVPWPQAIRAIFGVSF